MNRVRTFAATLLLAVIFLATPLSRPQAAYVNPTLQEYIDAVKIGFENGLNMESTGLGLFSQNNYAITSALIGICDAADGETACPAGLSYQKSALAGISSAIVAMYENPPASTYAFVVDAGKTLGFLPRTYAQGIGFSGLSPILPLWKAFRNVAYLLLAIILIAIGFMVMFRKKIDPKTVVTVQNSLPRIVVALLLITFSYAIVGIMIDLMYFSIVLIINVLVPAAGSNASKGVSDYMSQFIGGNFGTTLSNFVFKDGWSFFTAISDMLTGNNPTVKAATMIIPGVITFLITGSIKGAAVGAIAAPGILMLLIAIILITAFVRVVFLLVDAYINIIIALITAPLQLMVEAIPGTNAFSSWIRNLLSKLSVFPITAGLLLVAEILMSYDTNQSLWAPPFISAGTGTGGISSIIALGMLVIIPSVAGGVQKALKAEPAIPGGIAPILGPLGSGFGQITSLAYQGSFIASAVRHKPDERTPMQQMRAGAEGGFSSLTGGGGGHH